MRYEIQDKTLDLADAIEICLTSKAALKMTLTEKSNTGEKPVCYSINEY